MLSRPSSRRKSGQEELNLNLVPMLDALVTLVAFLLFSTSFLSIAVIDTPAPVLAPADQQLEKMKEKPLQLTAYVQEKQILISDWSGSRESHTIPNVTDPKTSEPRYDFEKFHQILIEIKNRYPNETKLILKPESGVAYEVLISIMDAARFFEKTDPPFFKKSNEPKTAPQTPKAGGAAPVGDQPEKYLFPEVIFGNIMS